MATGFHPGIDQPATATVDTCTWWQSAKKMQETLFGERAPCHSHRPSSDILSFKTQSAPPLSNLTPAILPSSRRIGLNLL